MAVSLWTYKSFNCFVIVNTTSCTSTAKKDSSGVSGACCPAIIKKTFRGYELLSIFSNFTIRFPTTSAEQGELN